MISTVCVTPSMSLYETEHVRSSGTIRAYHEFRFLFAQRFYEPFVSSIRASYELPVTRSKPPEPLLESTELGFTFWRMP